jgi:hypothetical protein
MAKRLRITQSGQGGAARRSVQRFAFRGLQRHLPHFEPLEQRLVLSIAPGQFPFEWQTEAAVSGVDNPGDTAFVSALDDAGLAAITAPRGRPTLNTTGTTFVADNGALLRGPFASTEWGAPPPLANIQQIKNYGANAIHLYGEVFDPNYQSGVPGSGTAPGYALNRIDQMVQMTRDEGLYLVLTPIATRMRPTSFSRSRTSRTLGRRPTQRRLCRCRPTLTR